MHVQEWEGKQTHQIHLQKNEILKKWRRVKF